MDFYNISSELIFLFYSSIPYSYKAKAKYKAR